MTRYTRPFLDWLHNASVVLILAVIVAVLLFLGSTCMEV